MTVTPTRVVDLDPSLVCDRAYVTRRRQTYIDSAALLSIMIILISLIPARLIVPGMTDLGRPGLIVGFLLFCCWVLAQLNFRLTMAGPHPMRWAVLIFMVTLLSSYASGFLRGLTSMEANAADRTMLFFCIFLGVVLTCSDGVPNWHRLRAVARVLVGCAAIVAGIALIQYLLNDDVTRYLTVPGLQAKGWTPGFEVRGSGGTRVAATTTHYIELAAFLALALPFAIHYACFSRRAQHRRWATLAALLISAGIATTISRTGILAVALMLVVLVPAWRWRQRYNILVLAGGLFAVLAAAKPGLARTLFHLFGSASSDPSFTTRTARYPLVFHYVAQRPILGRGTGTWVAPQYQILDNQWLDTMITNGVVGVLALAGLQITGIVLAWLALRRSQSEENRHLCAALISTQVIGLAVAGTFDSLSFMTYATVLALTLGMCGTVWRLTHRPKPAWTAITR